VTVFLSRQATPDGALKVLDQYLAFLKDYGQVVSRRDGDGVTTVVGDTGGLFDVIFVKGDRVGGVMMAGNREEAEKMVEAWVGEGRT
jgi:hypothetical protein